MLEEGTVVAALAVGAVEGTLYGLQRLQVWESFLMTPLIPILVTFALFVDYEVKHYDDLGKDRWARDDFKKSSLLILGCAIATFGLGFLFAAVSTDLTRVTIDVGASSSLICLGAYVVKRFAW
ncbi:MAG: hypothetical protein JRN54_08410 [Nitrososphaerota archaeon]|nr:hypothetical protein [Nitrososphaerota archaeon]MDG6971110.1 hypothetical protein [Nitrososphaerota archaeon]